MGPKDDRTTCHLPPTSARELPPLALASLTVTVCAQGLPLPADTGTRAQARCPPPHAPSHTLYGAPPSASLSRTWLWLYSERLPFCEGNPLPLRSGRCVCGGGGFDGSSPSGTLWVGDLTFARSPGWGAGPHKGPSWCCPTRAFQRAGADTSGGPFPCTPTADNMFKENVDQERLFR